MPEMHADLSRPTETHPDRGYRRFGRHLIWGIALIAIATAAEAQDSTKVKVNVEGIGPELARNVRAVMRLARAADDGKPLPKSEVQRLYRRGEADVRLGLEPFGFYEPRIESTLEEVPEGMLARFLVDAGPAVRVRSLSIDVRGPGRDAPEFREVVEKFPLQQGDTLYHLRYQAGKIALLTVASDSGYLDAKFDTATVVVDRVAGAADVKLAFSTGQRFRFGPVRFEEEIIDHDVLMRRVPFRPGSPWKQSRLMELQTNLSEDPYFSRVDVMPDRWRAKGLEVPIRVVAEPRKPRAFEFGLGYGTDTGPRGRAGANLRWINRRGHQVTAEAVASLREQSFTAGYVIPAFATPTGNLSFNAGYARLAPSVSTSQALTAGLKAHRYRLGWQETLSLNYLRESFTIGADTGVANLLIVGAGWERTRADDRLFPSRGIRTEVQVQGSQKGLVGSNSFVRLHGSGKLVYQFAQRLRLLTRIELGYLTTQDFRDLPPTLRFFTGGDQSVRGYEYLTLGPRDSTGHVLGGAALFVTSAEVDYHLLPRWIVAGFTDWGNATRTLSLTDLRQSIGVGVRFLAPVGLIRFDVAFPMSGGSRSPFRLHFSIGPDL